MTQVFRMPPAPESAFAVFGEVPPLIQLLTRRLERWGRETRFELDERALRIRGTLYGRRIARRHLDVEAARAVDLTIETDLVPVLRTNGIGLPGYSAGWFRLRNLDSVLMFVTDPERVVLLPTHKRFSVLLSVEDPESLLDALRTRVPA